MFSRSTTKYLFAGLALFCASPSLFASTPAATFAELDGKPGLELVRAPRFSSARFALEARDLDRDSDLDIVLRHRVTRQELAWWRNDGQGHLTRGDSAKLYQPSAPPSRTLQPARARTAVPLDASPNAPVSLLFPTPACLASAQPAPIAVSPNTVPTRERLTPPLRGPPASLLTA